MTDYKGLAETLRGAVESDSSETADRARQGVEAYTERCEAELLELAKQLEQRLQGYRAELELLYARRTEHERVSAARRREGELIEDALASVRAKLEQLPKADAERYAGFLRRTTARVLADREGPLRLRCAPRDGSTLRAATDAAEAVEVIEDATVTAGLIAEETATGGVIDARLDSIFQRSRPALAARLVKLVFGGRERKESSPGDA